MDSLTQIVLGAAVGEAALGRKVGNKALLWGAVGGTIPDLDVIGRAFLHPVDALHFHRGPMHSIVFCLLFAPVMGWLLHRLYVWREKNEASWAGWTLLSFLALFTHPILDCFTTWGTQLFWPFTDYAIAWQSVFVVDPFYTVPFLTCVVWLMFKKRDSRARRRINTAGLVISSCYLALTVVNKQRVNAVFEEAMHAQHIDYVRYCTRPAPAQTALWAVNAETDTGYVTGYYSFFDADRNVRFMRHSKNHALLGAWKENPKTKLLLHITQGWYNVVRDGDALVINDFRFGTISGWMPSETFVFRYRIWKENGVLQFKQEQARKFEEGFLDAYIKRVLGEKPTPAEVAAFAQ